MRHVNRLLSATLCVVLCGATACRKPVAPPPTEVIVTSAREVPSDPSDAAWEKAPEYTAALVMQDLVEPRQLTATTPSVRVRAIGNGTETAFRLEWDDTTPDDLPNAARFCDACAVQFPQKAQANVPAPQMGEAGRAVEIAYWNASRQAVADGRGQSIKDLYPNASVDHYPFEAKPLEKTPTSQAAMTERYAPARAIWNLVANVTSAPVQDLIAEGPGTLAPASSATSRGKGVRIPNSWAVVIIRTTPIACAPPGRTNIALAVWDGAHEEVGARKMRTGWIPAVLPGQLK